MLKENIIITILIWLYQLVLGLIPNMYDVLNGKGKISHDKAMKKADSEYDKYAVIQDKSYISDFDELVYETEQLK